MWAKNGFPALPPRLAASAHWASLNKHNCEICRNQTAEPTNATASSNPNLRHHRGGPVARARDAGATPGPGRRVDRLPRNSRARDGVAKERRPEREVCHGAGHERATATGDPCPCFFATRCPAPGSNFSRQLVHYGFAPDTGRASKHHSYEDHGSKPECPGLHDE